MINLNPAVDRSPLEQLSANIILQSLLNKKEVTMSTKALTKKNNLSPSVFDDFFRPWNEWFTNGGSWDRALTVPSANIIEEKDSYKVSVAAPGLKKK